MMRWIIKTDRLALRELQQSDFEALCAILQDEEVMYAYEHAFSDAEVHEWIDRQLERYMTDGFGLWAVILKETGALIGQCGLTTQDCGGERVVEVGYLFARAFWHQGFATEAAIACKEYAFRELDVDEVFSLIRDTNEASKRVAERNGMAPRSTFIKHYYGIDMPHIAYTVSNPDEAR